MIEPNIILRECISSGGRFPMGMIMVWPADWKLPPGMTWLREQIYTAGTYNEAVIGYGDFTEEAKRIMQEVLSGN